jgi:hypothetical protein
VIIYGIGDGGDTGRGPEELRNRRLTRILYCVPPAPQGTCASPSAVAGVLWRILGCPVAFAGAGHFFVEPRPTSDVFLISDF